MSGRATRAASRAAKQGRGTPVSTMSTVAGGRGDAGSAGSAAPASKKRKRGAKLAAVQDGGGGEAAAAAELPCKWSRCSLEGTITAGQPRTWCKTQPPQPSGRAYYHTPCYQEAKRFGDERKRLTYALKKKPAKQTVDVLRSLVGSDETLMQVAALLTVGHGFSAKLEQTEQSHCARCHTMFDENYPAGCQIDHPECDEDQFQENDCGYGGSYTGSCGCEMRDDGTSAHWERPTYEFVDEFCFSGDHTTDWYEVEDGQGGSIECGCIEPCADLGCKLPAHQRDDDEEGDEEEDEA